MKYLIFGTGGVARRYMRHWYNGYFEHGTNSILAFVDNDVEKIGNKFLHKPIISPSDINKYDYDYIVICSSFIKEIKSQLIDEVGCNPDCILTQTEVEKLIYNYFDIELGLRLKKFVYIVFSEEEKREAMSFLQLQPYFEKSPVVICYNELSDLDMSKFDYVLMNDVYGLEEFYVENQPVLSEKNLIIYLSEILKISSDRIFTEGVRDFLLFSHGDRNECWGEQNPDKTFYVIRMWPLHSIVQMARTGIHLSAYARSKGYIPVVDGQTIPTALHEADEVGKINIWEKFFEQPDAWNMEDIQYSKNVILSCRYTGTGVSEQAYNNLIMKPKLKEVVDNFGLQLKKYKKVLGVHYRGTDYNNGRYHHHAIQPTIEQMISVVKDKIYEWNQEDGEEFDAIFLCTEAKDAIPIFYQHFADMMIVQDLERWPSDCVHSSAYAVDHFKSKYDWAVGYWVDVMTLSKCHSLVSCLCVGQKEAERFNRVCYQNDSPYVHIYYVCNGWHGDD